MTYTELLLSIIIVLLGGVGYFIKRILDATDAIREDVNDIKPKVKILWELQFASSKSPLVPNEKGADILEKSGIKEMVDAASTRLVEEIKEKAPQNPYQIQEYAKAVMLNMKNNADVLQHLQEGAFNAGVDVDTILFIGSLYLRDLALPEFSFASEDTDDVQ